MHSPLDLYCACQPGRRRQRGVQYLNLHMIQHHCVSFSRPPHPPRYGVAEPSKGVSFPGIWRAVFLRWAGSFLLARGGFCPSWVVFFCGCGWCLLFGALGPLGASACPGLSPFLLAVVCLLALCGLCPPRCFSLLLFSYTFGVCSLAAPCGFCSRLVYMSDRLPD